MSMETILFGLIQIMVILVAMYIGFKTGVHAAARRARTVSMVLMIAAEKTGVDFPAFMDEATRLLDEEIGK